MTVETTGTRTSRHHPAGFSLAELMFALAILGIALTALAPLFPAAVRENQSSANNVVGTLICKNVLAVAKARLSHQGMAGVGTNLTQILPAPSGLIGVGDLKYPHRGGTVTRGALLFARRIAAGVNDYLLVVVSYAKLKPAHVVEARRLGPACKIDAGATTFTAPAGKGNLLKIRSPVIAPDGRFAFIKSVSGDEATLDRPISTTEAVSDPFVIVATNGTTVLGDITSPVMSVLVTRTALRE